MEIEKRYVCEMEAARLIGCSVHSMRKWRCYRVGLPYHKINRTIRYYLPDIYEYMKARKVYTENDY